MKVVFPEDYSNMTITLSQDDRSAVVYDIVNDEPVAGSATLDMSMLKDSNVCWLVVNTFLSRFMVTRNY